MIFIRKIAVCDVCGCILQYQTVDRDHEVNREMSDLLYRQGWRFDGKNLIKCRNCLEKEKRDA